MSEAPHLASIAELAPQIASGQLTSLALTDACLERIERDDPRVNAFITVVAEAARAQARELDHETAGRGVRGPLHGIPISLKDLVDLADVPTTGASRLLAGHVARTDAVVTARLRAAGCVFLGKCNLHEVAFGTTSEDSAYGPVRNPWDPSRSAGGSSGGSAAAVVTGMGCASVGTDTGGSIRIPAAACGCVGLKPTYGELSCDGIIPLSRSLDHVGPLARCVADARLLYEAMSGRGTRDARGGTRDEGRGTRGERRGTRDEGRGTRDEGRGTRDEGRGTREGRIRLGILRPYFMDVLEPAVRSRFEDAMERLRQAGADAAERRIAHAPDIATIYLHLQLPEASAYHAAAVGRHPERYTPAVRLRIEMGRYVRAEDYVRAQQGAEVLRKEVDDALEGCDALVLPTLPILAPPLGKDSLEIDGASHPIRALMLRLTQLFDITGHPAVSLPCGGANDGLPVGIQLVGGRGETAALLDVAGIVEAQLQPWPNAAGNEERKT